jgi:hypothetical protein
MEHKWSTPPVSLLGARYPISVYLFGTASVLLAERNSRPDRHAGRCPRPRHGGGRQVLSSRSPSTEAAFRPAPSWAGSLPGKSRRTRGGACARPGRSAAVWPGSDPITIRLCGPHRCRYASRRARPDPNHRHPPGTRSVAPQRRWLGAPGMAVPASRLAAHRAASG